jgi:DNA-binding GntR family transcriptional regulator
MANTVPGTLAGQAYDALEAQLVSLRWKPGTAVQEIALAEAVGIGRTPVREAVQKLAAHGLLQVMPRKGLIIAPLQRSELRQVIEARRVLERLLVVKAAERAGPQQRRALAGLSVEIADAGDDLEHFMELDRALDQEIGQAGANPYLISALAPLHAHCRRLWYLQRGRLDLPQAALLHSVLAQAISGADGSGAIRALNGIIAVLEAQVGALDVIS